MSYKNGLKALRERLLSDSTGREAPTQDTVESFIPSRTVTEAPQESTEDILSRGATWLSDIRGSAEAFKRQYEMGRPKGRGVGKGLAEAADTLARGLTAKVRGKESEEVSKEEAKEGFIKKRSESSPSTYAPERPEEKRGKSLQLKEAAPGAAPGYGEVTRKSLENIIRSEATIRNIDPDVAVAIFRSEGAGNYQSQVARSGKGSYDGKEDSYGPYQLYRGGGLGNEYEKRTGRDLRADNTPDGITNQVRFALDAAVDQGWTPWYGRKTAGVSAKQGLAGAKKVGNWK